jgi:septal ring factor EnvC (AmiA/AmiB activator)
MTTDISREELLAHIGYVRDDVGDVRGDLKALQASVDKIGERTAANERAIARLEDQHAAAEAASARRRTSADAVVVAVLGATLAGAIEWVKAHLLTGAAAK